MAVCGRETELPALASPIVKHLVSSKGAVPAREPTAEADEALSPRKQRQAERAAVTPKAAYYIKSPVPYLAVFLVAVMMTMIFVNVISISALIAISALIMVLCIVLGNHFRGNSIWNEVATGHERLSREERIEVLQEFFEEVRRSACPPPACLPAFLPSMPSTS